ncbi:MAG: class I SAM-dependent methyltransferase [Ardenticatenaceae bacterium]|nr:class I SAM-dependent methyltransferase [Ardenticatenaceae bacterium]
MLNVAIRYQPILAELRRLQPEMVLEVGSGPEGLALFWRRPVVGTDIQFKRRPLKHIQPVVASSLALPFADRAWPVVVSCDMLEHVPPPLRAAAVAELARVCDRALVLAFPSGGAATVGYDTLAAQFRRAGRPLPGWLSEHLRYGLPDAESVAALLHGAGWSVRTSWHEPVADHVVLMWWESRRPVQAATYGLMRLAGPWLAPCLPSDGRGTPLRALLVAARAGG